MKPSKTQPPFVCVATERNPFVPQALRVHEGVYCDICYPSLSSLPYKTRGMEEIRGTRYKILEDENMDVCEKHKNDVPPQRQRLPNTLVPYHLSAHSAWVRRNYYRRSVFLTQAIVCSAASYTDRPFLGVPVDTSYKSFIWTTFGDIFKIALKLCHALCSELAPDIYEDGGVPVDPDTLLELAGPTEVEITVEMQIASGQLFLSSTAEPLRPACRVHPSTLETPRQGAVLIIAANSPDWFALDMACLLSGILLFPLQPQSSADAIVGTVKKFNIRIVFADFSALHTVSQALRGLPVRVVVVGNTLEGVSLPESYTPWGHFIDCGKSVLDRLAPWWASIPFDFASRRAFLRLVPNPYEVNEDDVGVLLGTSGSTGLPKFAIKTRGSTKMGISASIMPTVFSLRLNYSTFAHSGPRDTTWCSFSDGGAVVLYDGQHSETIKIIDAANAIMPTVFGAAPTVWHELYDRYTSELKQRYGPTPTDSEKTAMKDTYRARYEPLMARSRAMNTGSAPTRGEVVEFCQDVFGFSFSVGYGLTEIGTVMIDGRLYDGVKVVLKSIPELGYDAQGQPPCGEVCVKEARESFEGYFGDAEVTQAAVTEEGYYRTGDIAERLPNGNYKLIDRIGNIVKLGNGKFVAVQSLEVEFNNCTGVRQICLAVTKGVLQGIVVPADQGATVLRIHEELAAHARAKGMPQFEVPSHIVLARQPFTVDNGQLTGSHKISRRVIVSHYRDELDQLSEGMGSGLDVLDVVLQGLRRAVEGATDGWPENEYFTILADSLRTALLVSRINNELAASVRVKDVVACRNFGELLHLLKGSPIDESEGAIEAMGLDMNWVTDAVAIVGPCPLPTAARHALVTGAAGFIGAHLLHHLLLRTTWAVTCIVRGGAARLASQAREYQIDLDYTRLTVLEGDLSLRCVGLSAGEWDALAGSVDVVVHCGASVNWTLPFRDLKAANVDSTIELIRFCTETRPKRLVYVSTGSHRPPVHCPVTRGQAQGLPGYPLSKYISEDKSLRARDSGLPVLVLRPGFVSWHSETGVANSTDALGRVVLGCLHRSLGCIFNEEYPMHAIPVDATVRAMVDHILGDWSQCIVNLLPDNPIVFSTEIITAVDAAYRLKTGRPIQQVPYSEWQRRLREQNDPSSPLTAIAPHFSSGTALHAPVRLAPHEFEFGNCKSLADQPRVGFSSASRMVEYLVAAIDEGKYF